MNCSRSPYHKQRQQKKSYIINYWVDMDQPIQL